MSHPDYDRLRTWLADHDRNLDRLRDYFSTCRPSLLLTLGTEAAAFVREVPFARAKATVDTLLYDDPTTIEWLGCTMTAVHLVHPHLFIKNNPKWMKRHRAWCERAGRKIVQLAHAADVT